MKKRKPPVMMASILVVLVAVVAIMNGRTTSHEAGDGHDHGQEQTSVENSDQVLAQSRETESKASLAAMTKGKVKKPRRPGEEEAADEPVVSETKKFKYNPQPGESPVNTQWYTEQSGLKEKN